MITAWAESRRVVAKDTWTGNAVAVLVAAFLPARARPVTAEEPSEPGQAGAGVAVGPIALDPATG